MSAPRSVRIAAPAPSEVIILDGEDVRDVHVHLYLNTYLAIAASVAAFGLGVLIGRFAIP